MLFVCFLLSNHLLFYSRKKESKQRKKEWCYYVIDEWKIFFFCWWSVDLSIFEKYFFSVIFGTGKYVGTGAITGAIVGAYFIDVDLMCWYGAYNRMIKMN